jgi:hypothetical protein
MNLNKRKNTLNINIGIKTFYRSPYIVFENSLNKNKNIKINKKQILFFDYFNHIEKNSIKYYLYVKKFNSFNALNFYKTKNLIVFIKIKHILIEGGFNTKLELFSWKNCLIKYYHLIFKNLLFLIILQKKIKQKI